MHLGYAIVAVFGDVILRICATDFSYNIMIVWIALDVLIRDHPGFFVQSVLCETFFHQVLAGHIRSRPVEAF